LFFLVLHTGNLHFLPFFYIVHRGQKAVLQVSFKMDFSWLVGSNFNLASEGEQPHNNYHVQNSHDGKVAINLRSFENNDLDVDECIDHDRVKKQLS
jgi:hypothetical protein